MQDEWVVGWLGGWVVGITYTTITPNNNRRADKAAVSLRWLGKEFLILKLKSEYVSALYVTPAPSSRKCQRERERELRQMPALLQLSY